MNKTMKKVVLLKTFLLILQVNVRHSACKSVKSIPGLPAINGGIETPMKQNYKFHRKYYTNLTTLAPKATSKLSQLTDSKTVFSKNTSLLSTSQLKNLTTVPSKTISHSSTSNLNDLKRVTIKTMPQFMKPTTVTPKVTSQSTSKSTESKPIPPKTVTNSTSQSPDSGIVPPKTTSQIEKLTPAPSQNTSQLLNSKPLNSTTEPPKPTTNLPISKLSNSTTILPETTSLVNKLTPAAPQTTSHVSISKSANSTTVPTNITTPSTISPDSSTSKFMNSTPLPSNITSPSSTPKSLDLKTEPPKAITNLPTSKSSNLTTLPPNTTSHSSSSNFNGSKIVPPETSQLEKSTPAPPETPSHLSMSNSTNSTTIPLNATSNLPTSKSSNSTTVSPETASHISTSMNSSTKPPETSHSPTSQLSKPITHSSQSQSTNSTTPPPKKHEYLQDPAIEELTGFENLVSSSYYVDKTLLLRSLFHSNSKNGECRLITMPKGFGKTTNLEMIKRFCEIEVNLETGLPISKDLSNVRDTPNYALFTNEYNYGRLKISHDGDFMKTHFGKYPVIYLDFAKSQSNFKPNIDGAIDWIQNTISEAFAQHEYLINSTKLKLEQKAKIEQWCDYRNHKLIPTYDIVTSLLDLLDYLHIHYWQEVIVLVDEYDLLARWAIEKVTDEYELSRILDFYICIFSNALRDQPRLKFALLTGIIHIDYSGFRVALPDLKAYRLGRNDEFVKFYGFTTEEVDSQLQKFEIEIDGDLVVKAMKYYDGYSTIDGDKIYTPVSITRLLHNKKVLNYWSRGIEITSFWPALRLFDVRMIMMNILFDDGPKRIRNLHKLNLEDISALQNCLDEKKNPGFYSKTKSIFYNYLLDLGYLKINSQDEDYIEVAVPNIETYEALNLLLDTYYKKTATREEFRIQTDFVEALKNISLMDHREKIQQITTNLSQLIGTVSSQIYNFQPDDFKQMLREVFIRHDLQSYGEGRIRIRTKEDKEKNGLADFFLTNLQNIYIVIETGFQNASWSALQKIKYDLPKFFASVKNNSTIEKSFLWLGINLQRNRTVTISEKYTYTPNNFTFEGNHTEYNSQFLTFENTTPGKKTKK